MAFPLVTLIGFAGGAIVAIALIAVLVVMLTKRQ